MSHRYRLGEDRPVVPSLPNRAPARRTASGPTRTGLGQAKAAARPLRRLTASRPNDARENSTRLSNGLSCRHSGRDRSRNARG